MKDNERVEARKTDPNPRHDENLARLARIEGQVRGVRRMIESGAYCIDIVNQVEAVRAALSSVSRQILRKHLEHCVSGAMQCGRPVEAKMKIDELMDALKRM